MEKQPIRLQPDASPSYGDRYMAFVDVLGFSSIIAKSTSDDEVVQRVHQALAGISRKATAARSPHLDVQATSFSDNVVISLPASGPGLFHLIGMINNFSQQLLSLGMLFRGAIVRGRALHTEEVVFGPALVDAYRLETSVSLHPRIMLSDPVMEDVRTSALASPDHATMATRLVREDAFDVPYINLFADWEDDDVAWSSEAIAKLSLLRNVIMVGLSENGKNPNVAEKYKWIARRLNSFLDTRRLGTVVQPIDLP